jgi:hypothetical protein
MKMKTETQATTPNLRKLSASEIEAVFGGLNPQPLPPDANPPVVCKYPAGPEWE